METTTQHGAVTAARLNSLDRIGAAASTLCAVHCLLMPLLLAALPALGVTFLANRAVERAVAAALVLFATGCVWRGCRIHGRWTLFALLAPGAVTCTHAISAAPDCCAADAFSWPNALMMTLGGGMVAGSHWFNRRLRARCACHEGAPPTTTETISRGMPA
jgi:MerC mercury resistance protein